MPSSYAFANGSVHVLEGKMLSAERIERLISAADASDAIKALQETGYGRGEEIGSVADYEGWLDSRAQEAYAFVRRVSPEPASTDCFLLALDYTNLKALYKARHLEQDADGILRKGGLYSLELMADAMREQDYRRLSGFMQSALKALDTRAVSGLIDPRSIDTILDKAMFSEIAERVKEAKSKAVKEYFRDLADLTNLRAALRARAMRMGHDELAEQLVPGGDIPLARIEQALEEPERAIQAFAGRAYKRQLDEAIAAYGQDGSLARFELIQDNHLLSLIKRGRWTMESVEPLAGYLLGIEREIAAIRLCMVGQINGFPAEVMRERLGDLYV